MAELEGKSRSAGVSISSAFEKIGGIAKTGMKAIAGAITAATGAMAALGAKALEAYADYEQLTGGVATLFGAQDMSLEEYAQSVGKTVDAVKGEYDNLIAAQDAVMQNAAEAYRTAGMSANKYMDTVTSFSAALIASLDGDTAKAAQVADRAIVDMSDNANKMGSSMESIQTAYQGFAKQNYTMLDNLKLGYGGTKSEMERLLADAEKLSGIHYNLDSYADIVEAIHVIQTQMGITGTTAKEAAETISGSVAMTKAAFSNLLVGIADDEQDFEKLVDDLVNSATTAAGNILPRVETIIGGLGKMISSLSGIAANMLVDLTAYVPDLVEAGVSLIGAVADGLTANAPAVSQAALDAGLLLVDGIMSVTPDLLALNGELISTLIDGLTEHLPVLVDAAMETGLSILSGITAHLPDIIEAAKNIITKITDVLVTNIPLVANAVVQIVGSLLETLTDPSLLTSLLDAALQIILTLAQALLDNIPQIIEIISTLITNVIDFIIEAVPMLLDAAIQLFMAIVDALPQIIDALTKELPRILDAVVSVIPQLVQALAKALPQIIQAITQAIPIIIQAITQNLPQIINALILSLLSMNTQLLDAAIQLLYAILDALPIINEALLEALPEIIDAIVTVLIEAVPQMYEAAFTLFMALVEALPEVLEKLVEYFGEMFTIVDEWIDEIFTNAVDAVASWFSQMIGDAKKAASDLVTGAMQFLDELPGKIGEMLGYAVGSIVQFAQDAPAKAKEAAEQFLANVVEFFTQLPDKAKEFLDSTIEKVQTWAADLAKKGKEGAADLVKKIETEISTLPQKMFDAGRNLVEGLWNGISNMGNWLKEKISSFAGGIISGFKDAFGIESPSKVMRDSVGKYLAQGIGVGFTEEIPEIGKAALDAFSDLKLPDIDMNVRSDIPKPKLPHIDGDAVNMIRTFNDRPDSGLIQPSPTSEITNNYYSSSTSNRTVSEKPVVNVYNNMNVEMDGEKVAELVAEKVDILQGETVEMDERGTAH
ncbi:MAG: hypothetical protein IJL32_04640 [Oscillospiraceae bacterium]|nr:hypothetical protein [Oscillospiraceae bacterium]